MSRALSGIISSTVVTLFQWIELNMSTAVILLLVFEVIMLKVGVLYRPYSWMRTDKFIACWLLLVFVTIC